MGRGGSQGVFACDGGGSWQSINKPSMSSPFLLLSCCISIPGSCLSPARTHRQPSLLLAEPVPLADGSLLWSHPRGWGCHREQLMSSKPWLQGWPWEVSGVPHSSSHAMDQRQHGLGHGARWAAGHIQGLSTCAEAARAGWLSTGWTQGCLCSKLLPFSRYHHWVPRLDPALGTQDKQRTRVATQHFPAMQRCVGGRGSLRRVAQHTVYLCP